MIHCLFISNNNDDDAVNDDSILYNLLCRSWLSVEIICMSNVSCLSGESIFKSKIDRIILRNCWPDAAIIANYIHSTAVTRGIPISPPIPRRNGNNGYEENKRYLVDLFRAGFPVLETILSGSTESLPHAPLGWLAKPLNGCGSRGLVRTNDPYHLALHISGNVVQPWVDLDYEISFYFIDRRFMYATRSLSHKMRWSLEYYNATFNEIRWANVFLNFCGQKFGITRIDAGRLSENGQLVLMEIEDTFCMLSIDILSEMYAAKVGNAIAHSILTTPVTRCFQRG